MRKLAIVLAVGAAGLALANPAFAAHYTLEGGATASETNFQLVANTGDASTTNDSSVVRFGSIAIKLGELTTLSAQFSATDDGCAAGSPRIVLRLDDGTFVHVALGTLGGGQFTCATTSTFESSGNLVGQTDACRWSTTGTLSDPCLSATDLQALATKTITEAWVVVDASWTGSTAPGVADKEQTVLLTSLTLNNRTITTAEPQPPTTKPKPVNPAQFCKAERTRLGSAAFNEHWGTNANDRNAFGKCVSASATGKTQSQIESAIKACKERGLRRAALGACVAGNDGVAVTKSEAQEQGKSRGKGKRGKS